MTIREIQDALKENVVRESYRPLGGNSREQAEYRKANQALIAAVHALDDYYKHCGKATKIYCEQFKK
jgi:hypothetical protein